LKTVAGKFRIQGAKGSSIEVKFLENTQKAVSCQLKAEKRMLKRRMDTQGTYKFTENKHLNP